MGEAILMGLGAMALSCLLVRIFIAPGMAAEAEHAQTKAGMVEHLRGLEQKLARVQRNFPDGSGQSTPEFFYDVGLHLDRVDELEQKIMQKRREIEQRFDRIP